MMLAINQIKKILNILVSGILFIVTTNQVFAEWTELSTTTEISYQFQDNINHSVFDEETESDHRFNALLSVGGSYQLTANDRIFINTTLDASSHERFEKLNHLNLGVGLTARHKFGFGAYQPWISGSVFSHHVFSKSRIREGQITTIGFDLGKRLNNRLQLSLNYRFDYRDSRNTAAITNSKLIANGAELGKSSSVFDIKGHAVGVKLDALLSQKWLLMLAYNFRDGDIVSSNRPALVSDVNSIIDAIVNDDALPGWAYRTQALTHRYSVDANYAFLQGHAAFNLGYEYTDSFSGSFNYQNHLFRVHLIYNF